MSLIKQLWLTITGVLLLTFIGSLLVGVTSSHQYIEQEIRIKNIDNTNALALSMSQMDKDPISIQLLLAAQFDTGHYQLIELIGPDGEVIDRRTASEAVSDVPAWFRHLVSFEVPAGTAVVQDGWRQYGTLHLKSQHSYAYRTLWQSTLRLTGLFGLIAVISLALTSWLVHSIRRPLYQVVQQAQAMGERRFMTSKEPRTLELKTLVKSMNRLSLAVREMLNQETDQLEQLRRQLQHDAVTDTLNREAFLDRLSNALDSEGDIASGLLIMVRVTHLTEVNQHLGHQATDALLNQLSRMLEQLSTTPSYVGRLKGCDFALLLPGVDQSEALAAQLQRGLEQLHQSTEIALTTPAAISHYHQGQSRGQLLAQLDGALAQAENQPIGIITTQADAEAVLFTTHDAWRTALDEALQDGIELAHYPVMSNQGSLLHDEVPSRLKIKGEWRTAGLFMPWISRLDMNAEFDLAVTAQALADTAQRGHPVGVNLSTQALHKGDYLTRLINLIQQQSQWAHRLWFEMPETAATQFPTEFKHLCEELSQLGCQVGLEHVGPQFGKVEGIEDMGLHYIKLDATLSHDVLLNPAQQSLVRGMATLAHSLGIRVIAQGVQDHDTSEQLFRLGIDGVTGPGVRQDKTNVES